VPSTACGSTEATWSRSRAVVVDVVDTAVGVVTLPFSLIGALADLVGD
jgi:hypothetical protein